MALTYPTASAGGVGRPNYFSPYSQPYSQQRYTGQNNSTGAVSAGADGSVPNINSQGRQGGGNPLTNAYNTYGAAVNTNAQDYSDIMGKYNQLYSQMSSNPAATYNPQQYQYNESGDLSGALSNLKGLSQNGGYSDADIANLRARGVSPIRSVYASANRDIDRGRALQGGFSPNYAASKVKMARDMSQQIDDAMVNVNAGIADNQARNKLSASSAYGSLADSESNARNQYGSMNVNAANDASKFNISNSQQRSQQMADILKSMTSLYGTTPALSQLFGDQAMQGANLQNNIRQGNQQNNLRLISSMLSGIN